VMFFVCLLSVASTALASSDDPNIPSNFAELDCAVNQAAFEFGIKKIPSAAKALHDALRLDNCTSEQLGGNHVVAQNHAALKAPNPVRGMLPLSNGDSTIFVATTGSDNRGDGSQSNPFASLHKAQMAAQGVTKPAMVLIRTGKYFVNSTLKLGKQDSGVTWSAYKGEEVTLSGGVEIKPNWKPSSMNPKILVADVMEPSSVMSAEEQTYWQSYKKNGHKVPASSDPPSHNFGAPPATWNTLHVNGVRQVRARFPNGNPQDESGICFSKVQYDGEGCDNWLSAQGGVGEFPTSTTVAKITNGLDRSNAPASPCTDGGANYATFKYTIYDPPAGHPVYNKPMPDWTWTNSSYFSFWSDVLRRDAGVKYGTSIKKKYSNPGTGVVHMFHSGLWGGWQYNIVDQMNDSLTFGYGGFQEARGSGINNQHYYVENVMEELDAPTEWFHDPVANKLYFWPNGTMAPDSVVAPVLSAIVRIEGATDVNFVGVTFTETRATYFEQYEVSSGGDWSVHRGAAVEIVDSSHVDISNCTFDQVGGNGVLLSNNVDSSSVSNNEFVYCGDSGIVTVGSSNGIDGTAKTYPSNNVISTNHIHEIGIYGKQTSCYFQALAQNTTFEDNLCYNGPRAGINWNDGFAGGNLLKGNLVFNMVRETGDHGPFNSWDRQPYLTNSGHEDGYPASKKFGMANSSILKQRDFITQNFFINGYNGVWTIDHDDGSQYFNDTGNFMVYGGCKNYLGNHKSCDHNVIVHPGISNRASGGRRCQTDDNSEFANQFHDNNHCFTEDGKFYSMRVKACDRKSIDPSVYQTFNNTLYSANDTFSNGPCTSFQQWQQQGQDAGSSVKPMPPIADIIKMGMAVVGM